MYVITVQTPKISILVPAYNAEKTIAKCLRSLLRQTYKNIEIILVESTSTDNTAKIANEIASTDPRLRVHTKPNGGSVAHARNLLLELNTNDYFCWVDSDDYVKPRFVEKLYKSMEKHQSDMAICSFYFKRHLSFRYPFQKPRAVYSGDDVIGHYILDVKLYLTLWNKIFKTELARGIKFETDCRMGEDFFFCYEYLKRAGKVSYFNSPLYRYVLHGASITHETLGQTKIQFLQKLIALAEREPEGINKQRLFAWVAMTGALYYQLSRKSKTVTTEQKQWFVTCMAKYQKLLLRDRATSGWFKIIFRWIRWTVKRNFWRNAKADCKA